MWFVGRLMTFGHVFLSIERHRGSGLKVEVMCGRRVSALSIDMSHTANKSYKRIPLSDTTAENRAPFFSQKSPVFGYLFTFC